ncbi:UNVERIFIED_CONTAM: hypothetical protein FKN15_041913 [Acipenser sinensis]
MAGLQSEKKQTADGTRFGGRVCPSSSPRGSAGVVAVSRVVIKIIGLSKLGRK